MLSKILGTIFPKLIAVIDKAVPDKDLAEKLKAELQSQILTISMEETRIGADVVKAEINGESWLQRNWRPILMLTIVAIVANNYIIYPYLALLGLPSVVLELPEALFTLMQIGVGGYVVGRSAEKINKTRCEHSLHESIAKAESSMPRPYRPYVEGSPFDPNVL